MTDQPLVPEPPALPSTPAEAATRLDQLKADPKWTASFLSGSPTQLQEFRDLHETIAKGNDDVSAAMAGIIPEMPSSDLKTMAGTASMLKDVWLYAALDQGDARGQAGEPGRSRHGDQVEGRSLEQHRVGEATDER
ncbi:hypothetical protein ACVJF1_008427 [Bradyrhizobium diazoefficiens]